MIEKNILKIFNDRYVFDDEGFYQTCFSWLSKEIKPFLLRFAGELLTAFQGLYVRGVTTTGKYIGTAHQKGHLDGK
jgi:hypothetical protein